MIELLWPIGFLIGVSHLCSVLLIFYELEFQLYLKFNQNYFSISTFIVVTKSRMTRDRSYQSSPRLGPN